MLDQIQRGHSDENAERPRWVVLAHVLRPQGRVGEVLADLFSDSLELFDPGKRVYLAKQGFAGTPDKAQQKELAAYFLPVGRNAGRIVLHLRGIDSIEAAETLSGLDVLVPETELPALDEDAAYVSELIGCSLFDRNAESEAGEVGTVTGVQFATTPDGSRRLEDAAPLLTVETVTGDEVLIPYVKDFLLSLDISGRRIEMSLPPGLLEINRK